MFKYDVKIFIRIGLFGINPYVIAITLREIGNMSSLFFVHSLWNLVSICLTVSINVEKSTATHMIDVFGS